MRALVKKRRGMVCSLQFICKSGGGGGGNVGFGGVGGDCVDDPHLSAFVLSLLQYYSITKCAVSPP
jgi:hypothetical protein